MYRLSISLKVIGTNKDRSAAYNFLLTFYSNHVSRTVSEMTILVENCIIFPTTVYLVTSDGL